VTIEVELTEEEKAELKMFEDFTTQFSDAVDQVKLDLSDYRALTHPENGIEKVALWPKTFTARELEKMRKAEEKKMKAAEEEEAEKRRIEEEKAAAAPAKKGGPPAKKGAAADRTASRGGVSSAASG